MERPTVGEKRRLLIYLLCCMLAFLVLIGRLAYIGLFRSSQWQEMAYEQQTRDRLITAKRGDIQDRNGVGIAETQSFWQIHWNWIMMMCWRKSSRKWRWCGFSRKWIRKRHR